MTAPGNTARAKTAQGTLSPCWGHVKRNVGAEDGAQSMGDMFPEQVPVEGFRMDRGDRRTASDGAAGPLDEVITTARWIAP